MFVWKNQYGSAETMNAGNNYVATTVSAVQKDDVEGNAAVDAAEAQIVRAKELLALAKETGEGKGAIDSLTRQVAIAEDNVIEVKQDAADDAARSAFKTRQADRRDAPNVYKGDQYSWQGNRDDLEIAIEERDIDKVKALVANLTTLLDTTNPSNDTMKKLGSVRGDALRAVNNMPQLIEQDKLDVAGKVRFDSMESLRSRVSDAASGNVANDKLVALIKELNAAISKEEDGEGGRNSELNVRTLTDMKATLVRRMI